MHYNHAAIRQLLRRLKHPAELEGLPLARALRQTFGTPTAFEAVNRALRGAFEQCGAQGERYAEIVRVYDVERKMSRVAAARELGVSPRSFFRLHAQAVGVLAEYVTSALSTYDAQRDPLGDASRALLEHDPQAAADILRLAPRTDAALSIEVMQRLATTAQQLDDFDLHALDGREGTRAKLHAARLADLRGDRDGARDWLEHAREDYARSGAFDREIEHEIALLEFARSRHAGVVADMRPRAEAVESIGKGLSGERALASSLAVGEVALLSGRVAMARDTLGATFQRAKEERNYKYMGFALLRMAEVHMLDGDAQEAMRLAKASVLALRAFPDGRMYADTFMARLSALIGEPWSARQDTGEYVWMSLAMNGVRLRGALRRGELPAEAVAAEALENARRGEEFGYTGIAAFSTATAALALPETDVAQRNELLLRAWALLVETGNHLIAYDIFVSSSSAVRDLGPLALDDAVALELTRVLNRIPGIGSIGCDLVTPSMSDVWTQILCAAAGTRAPSGTAASADAVAALLISAGITRFDRSTEEAKRAIATWSGAFLPPEQRARFARRLLNEMLRIEFLLESAVTRAS